MKLLRTFIERISRGVVIKRNIIVAGRRIPILVSPDAQLKYLKFGSNVFDTDLIDIAEKYLEDDSNVWDVGANVGVFTFAASQVASKGTVVSVEADIWLANNLRKTTKYPEYSDNSISVLPVALSNKNAVASFMIAERGRASNALESAGGRSQMGGVREKQYVPTLTLDTLLEYFRPPTFVKIDVEGAELLVLQGGLEIIQKTRPIFYIEVGKDVSNEIFEMFRHEKYQAYDALGEKLETTCAVNTIFIPIESSFTS